MSINETIREKPLKIILLAAVIVVSMLTAVFAPTKEVHALTGTEFYAGNIINDELFYDKNSMTTSQVQTFLNAKVPTCDTWGTEPYSSELTRAAYGTQYGNPPPYICLKDYTQEVPAVINSGSDLCTGSITAGKKSSSQIITEVSSACGINPQVLIVLLQKEQSLVTDEWPWPVQYRSATGYGCPDTAPCDTEYYGFFNQVYQAAQAFKRYEANPANYNYRAGRNNTILYNPNLTCGSSTVYINNQATANLYIYTPYQPNQAALNNLYGLGDSCSSYGNRNFWRMFNDWFGATSVPKSNVSLPTGIYTIDNEAAGKSVDVAGGGTKNGTSVQIYTTNNTQAQRWLITRYTDGYYSLKNIGSGKYLDVANASRSTGAKVQIWDGNDTCAQRWAFVESSQGLLFISKCSGLALDITDGLLTDGTALQLWNKNYSTAQLWSLASLDTSNTYVGFFEVSTPGGLALNTANNTSVNGSLLQIQESDKSLSQLWQIAKQPDGTYALRDVSSGRYLDASDLIATSGTEAQIWDAKKSCTQRWIISGDNTLGHRLQSACSDLRLDVRDGLIATPGTAVQLWTSNDSSAQKWQFTKTSTTIPEGIYSISSKTGLALDAQGGGRINGTNVQIWYKNMTSAQKWLISPTEDGFYTIKNIASSKLLDIAGGVIGAATNIQIWEANRTCAQKWRINDTNDGANTIETACGTTMALDISKGLTNVAGTNVQIFTKNKTSAQSWVIGTP